MSTADTGTRAPEQVMCGWFAMCYEPATTTRHHPIVGAVPICARCERWYGELDSIRPRPTDS